MHSPRTPKCQLNCFSIKRRAFDRVWEGPREIFNRAQLDLIREMNSMLIQQLNWFMRWPLSMPLAICHLQFAQINLVRNHVDKQITLPLKTQQGCPFATQMSCHFIHCPRTRCPFIVKEHKIRRMPSNAADTLPQMQIQIQWM